MTPFLECGFQLVLAVLGGWHFFLDLLIHASWLSNKLDYYGHQEQGGEGGIVNSHANLVKVCDDVSHKTSWQFHSFKNQSCGDLSKNLL
jgi:hypothetical protein